MADTVTSTAQLAEEVVHGYIRHEGPVPDAGTLAKMIELALAEALAGGVEAPADEHRDALQRFYDFRAIPDRPAAPAAPVGDDLREAIVRCAIAWHGLWGHATTEPSATYHGNRHWQVCRHLSDAVKALLETSPDA